MALISITVEGESMSVNPRHITAVSAPYFGPSGCIVTLLGGEKVSASEQGQEIVGMINEEINKENQPDE